VTKVDWSAINHGRFYYALVNSKAMRASTSLKRDVNDMPKAKVLNNLTEIERWMANAPNPATFRSNDDFMGFTVELMSRALYLLRVGVSLAPSSEIAERGYTKHRAIAIGHMVRITKLYEGLLIHVSKRQLELATIFTRLIFEAAVRLEYLITSKKKRASFRSFILSSYKPEKEVLEDLNQKAKTRPLIQIEKRMRRKMKSRLTADQISMKELMTNKNWRLDGKDFRRILNDIGQGGIYAYGFGSSSHFVHGDWYDISIHQIKKEGRYYHPDLEFDDPDPRIACSVTTICLGTLLKFLKWNRSDPDNYVRPIITKLMNLNRAVDAAHENSLTD
jgi:hypothetical protein